MPWSPKWSLSFWLPIKTLYTFQWIFSSITFNCINLYASSLYYSFMVTCHSSTQQFNFNLSHSSVKVLTFCTQIKDNSSFFNFQNNKKKPVHYITLFCQCHIFLYKEKCKVQRRLKHKQLCTYSYSRLSLVYTKSSKKCLPPNSCMSFDMSCFLSYQVYTCIIKAVLTVPTLMG
jgi:hypothetical protein